MLLSLESLRDDYSKIRMNINIPWATKYVKYHVSSLNTKANILLTTKEDRIVFDQGDPIKFENKYSFSEADVINLLSCTSLFKASYENKRLVITPNKDFSFTTITHRARLVTGLMNAKLNEVYEEGKKYYFDIPILDYANKLYLVSKQGVSVSSNIGDREYTPSIIASIDTFIKDGIPIIVNFESFAKPIKTVVNVDSFKLVEMELVDFMYQPIVLNSPLFITMKIKPCKSPKVKFSD